MQISELKNFFIEYSQAYLTFDADMLVEFFYFPSIIHDLSGIHLIKDTLDLKAYEQKFLEQLQQLQIAHN